MARMVTNVPKGTSRRRYRRIVIEIEKVDVETAATAATSASTFIITFRGVISMVDLRRTDMPAEAGAGNGGCCRRRRRLVGAAA